MKEKVQRESDIGWNSWKHKSYEKRVINHVSQDRIKLRASFLQKTNFGEKYRVCNVQSVRKYDTKNTNRFEVIIKN